MRRRREGTEGGGAVARSSGGGGYVLACILLRGCPILIFFLSVCVVFGPLVFFPQNIIPCPCCPQEKYEPRLHGTADDGTTFPSRLSTGVDTSTSVVDPTGSVLLNISSSSTSVHRSRAPNRSTRSQRHTRSPGQRHPVTVAHSHRLPTTTLQPISTNTYKRTIVAHVLQ